MLGVTRQTVQLQRVKRGEIEAAHVTKGGKRGLRIKEIERRPDPLQPSLIAWGHEAHPSNREVGVHDFGGRETAILHHHRLLGVSPRDGRRRPRWKIGFEDRLQQPANAVMQNLIARLRCPAGQSFVLLAFGTGAIGPIGSGR